MKVADGAGLAAPRIGKSYLSDTFLPVFLARPGKAIPVPSGRKFRTDNAVQDAFVINRNGQAILLCCICVYLRPSAVSTEKLITPPDQHGAIPGEKFPDNGNMH